MQRFGWLIVAQLLLALTLPLEAGKHQWNFAYDLEIQSSNLAEFDQQSLNYFPEFNDYVEHTFTVGYGYELPGFWIFKKPHVSLQGSALTRGYSGRLARESNGAYKQALLQEGELQFDLDLNSAFSFADHWSLFWNFNSTTFSSNDDDTGSAIHNYRFVTTSLGLQFSY